MAKADRLTMYAARMTERLKVTRPVTTEDANGAKVKSFVTYGTVYAERVRMTGSRALEAGEVIDDTKAEFIVRWNRRIEAGWRVETEGILFNVTSVVPNRKRGMRTLSCERVNL